MFNILVCDDDREIVRAVEIYLSKEGYNVLKAYDGNECIEALHNNLVHAIVLDIMMPVKDGIETILEIRKDNSIPIIMLTAKSEDEDKIKGLEYGADDYVCKPFNPKELVARVNSCIRRYTKFGGIENLKEKNVYEVSGLLINDDLKKVTVDGKEVKLTPTEYNILLFLTKNAGKVFSINQIYENIWEEDGFSAENIIAVHIRHIREKIEINPKDPRYLKVIWGIGYKIENIK